MVELPLHLVVDFRGLGGFPETRLNNGFLDPHLALAVLEEPSLEVLEESLEEVLEEPLDGPVGVPADGRVGLDDGVHVVLVEQVLPEKVEVLGPDVELRVKARAVEEVSVSPVEG